MPVAEAGQTSTGVRVYGAQLIEVRVKGKTKINPSTNPTEPFIFFVTRTIHRKFDIINNIVTLISKEFSVNSINSTRVGKRATASRRARGNEYRSNPRALLAAEQNSPAAAVEGLKDVYSRLISDDDA
jgi:hypothetical protein